MFLVAFRGFHHYRCIRKMCLHEIVCLCVCVCTETPRNQILFLAIVRRTGATNDAGME